MLMNAYTYQPFPQTAIENLVKDTNLLLLCWQTKKIKKKFPCTYDKWLTTARRFFKLTDCPIFNQFQSKLPS